MRKALIVGIDHYKHLDTLAGCVNDAVAVKRVLERHGDNTTNFQTPKLLLGDNANTAISKISLKNAARELFQDDAEIALFYFAGHGYVEDVGGYLCSSDSETGDDGFALAELVGLASKSPAKNRVLILDSCHSGKAANALIGREDSAEIAEGLTILTASTSYQTAQELSAGRGGVFTNLLVDALGGAAMNLVGHVTPGSVYAHIDQSLGPWAQRPMFKTHVKQFVSLRKAVPPIPLENLQTLARHFPTADYRYPLDPSFESVRSKEEAANPDIPSPDPKNTATFKVLQSYNRVGLVRPVDTEHMWNAAMERKSCELTMLGRHYRSLVAQGLI